MADWDIEFKDDVLSLNTLLDPLSNGVSNTGPGQSTQPASATSLLEPNSFNPQFAESPDPDGDLVFDVLHGITGNSPSPNTTSLYDDTLDSPEIDGLVTGEPTLIVDNTDLYKDTYDKQSNDPEDERLANQVPDAETTDSSPAADPIPPVPVDDPVNLVGGFGVDTLTGGSGDDTLDGSFGNDTLLGMAGDDHLLGNIGDDVLLGGEGDDYISGSSGDDTLDGGNGNDELNGGFQNDDLIGGSGDDTLIGWYGDDTLAGGDGNDLLDGGKDDDTFVISGDALGDTDTITDNDGDDVILFDGFNPFEQVQTVEQVGTDLVFTYAGGGSLTVDDFYGNGEIETISYDGLFYATNGDATSPISFSEFIASSADQILAGTDGNDNITGGVGHDRIFGGDGDDVLQGSGGNDEINGGEGVDTLSGGDGDDVLFGAGDGSRDFYSADTLFGDAGADTLNGGGGDDLLYGGDGDDHILGGFNDDTAHGDDGNDYLSGSLGDDTLSGGNGNDNLDGGFHEDWLKGDAGDDLLDGSYGDDTLDGGTGTDRLEGGNGNDTFIMRRGYGGDTVTDFTAFSIGATYADTLDLSDFGIASFSDLVMSEVDGNTTIDLGSGDSLVLEGVGSASLSDDDFTF